MQLSASHTGGHFAGLSCVRKVDKGYIKERRPTRRASLLIIVFQRVSVLVLFNLLSTVKYCKTVACKSTHLILTWIYSYRGDE